MSHAVFGQCFLEYLKVARTHHPVVFSHFLEVGIYTPLTDFVAYHRLLETSDIFRPVIIGPRCLCIDDALHTLSPCLNTRAGIAQEIINRQIGPSGTRAVQTTGIALFPSSDEISQIGITSLTSRFVTVHHHAERRMVTKLTDDAFTFLPDKAVQIASVTNSGRLVSPGRTFYLQVHTHLIGCCKCGFWRTPGMETHVIQSVLLAGDINLFPGLYIRRRETGLREYGTIQRTTQEQTAVVDGQFTVCHLHITETKTFGINIRFTTLRILHTQLQII